MFAIKIKYPPKYGIKDFTSALYISHGASWKTLCFTISWVFWPDEYFTRKNIAISDGIFMFAIKIKYPPKYGGEKFTPALYIIHGLVWNTLFFTIFFSFLTWRELHPKRYCGSTGKTSCLRVLSPVWRWVSHSRSVYKPQGWNTLFFTLSWVFWPDEYSTRKNISIFGGILMFAIKISILPQYGGRKFTPPLYIRHGASWNTLCITISWGLWPDKCLTPKNIAVLRCKLDVCIE